MGAKSTYLLDIQGVAIREPLRARQAMNHYCVSKITHILLNTIIRHIIKMWNVFWLNSVNKQGVINTTH
jgi:hypothetical protein